MVHDVRDVTSTIYPYLFLQKFYCGSSVLRFEEVMRSPTLNVEDNTTELVKQEGPDCVRFCLRLTAVSPVYENFCTRVIT